MSRPALRGPLAVLVALAAVLLARPSASVGWPAEIGPLPERASARVEAARLVLEAAARSAEELQAERARLGAELAASLERAAVARAELARLRGVLDAVEARARTGRPIVAARLLEDLRDRRAASAGGPRPSATGRAVAWLVDTQLQAEQSHRAIVRETRRLEQELAAVEGGAVRIRARLEQVEQAIARSRIEILDAALSFEDAERRRGAVERAIERTQRSIAGGDPAADLVPAAARSGEAEVGGAATASFRLPLAGAISQRFGDRRGGQRVRGVVVSAAGPQPVRAPGGGLVAFAGPFRDLGLLLIIDHGNDYHSLVIGASRLEVRVGEMVGEGQTVGWIDRDGSGSTDLYLELRRLGEPIDPMSVLTAHEGEGRG